MPDDEALGLLRELAQHATRDEFTTAVEYGPGDLAAWDTYSTLHKAPVVPKAVGGDPHARLLWRVSVTGICATGDSARRSRRRGRLVAAAMEQRHERICLSRFRRARGSRLHRGFRCRITGIIAIHSTAHGPALGGCRMYPYASEQDAIRDVLRLSRGMTYKAALTNVKLGGGKSVVIGDPARQKTEALLRAMGRAIERLQARYIAGEDIGTNPDDMRVLRQETRAVSCLKPEDGGYGDPAPMTALGASGRSKQASPLARHRPHGRGYRRGPGCRQCRAQSLPTVADGRRAWSSATLRQTVWCGARLRHGNRRARRDL